MRKKAFVVALISGGLLFGAGGIAVADYIGGPYGSVRDCQLAEMGHPHPIDCYQDPAGSGKWYFRAPQ